MNERPDLNQETVETRDRTTRGTVDDMRDDVQDMRDTRDDARNTRDDARTRDTRGASAVADTDDTSEGFLPEDRMNEYREDWTDVQAAFVDDPRSAVKRAHELVTDIVSELNETLARERSGLETSWNRGEEADTEDLRVALTRYRAFFNRLLR